jgi:hypothetical protein
MNRRTVTLSTAAVLLLVATVAHALTPVYRSSVRYGSTGVDAVYAIAVDPYGQVTIAGIFTGTVNFGGANLVSAGSYDIFVAKYFSNGAHNWSQRYGGTGFDEPHGLAVNGDGTVFMTGTFQNTVNFGGGNFVSAGAFDIFLLALTPGGAYAWSKRFGGPDYDFGTSIAWDNSGVYLTGHFYDTINFGGADLTSAGLDDIFVAKFDWTTGNHIWSQRFGDVDADIGSSLALSPSGNVCVTGSFEDNLNFGLGNLGSLGSSDVFLALFNSGGVPIWSKRFGGSSADFASGVAIDASSNIFATGGFMATANFGGQNFTALNSFYDVFLAKYNAAGNHLWSHAGGGGGNDGSQGIALDKSGNVYIGGYFTGSATFGSDNLFGGGGPDMFFTRYSANGLYHWSKGFGGASTDIVRALAVDKSGNVVAVGDFVGNLDFGGGVLTNAGGSDAVVIKYDMVTTEPLITSIKDIGNDQGRKVKIRFDRSAVDNAAAATPVTRYVAFRKDKAAPSVSAAPGSASGAALLATGWTEVGSVGAFAEDAYGIDVPTIGDSTVAQGPYNSTFYIRAATNLPATFYDSRPDSGYSLDNLAPGAPANFVYNAGNLTWDESSAADFDYFTVYGSNSNSFAAATIVNYTIATAMNVTASPYAYYFLTATDFSGNEGNFATIHTATGVGGTPTQFVLSVSNYPNPFNPRTTVSYTVPSRGAVTVAIYDLHGARITTLVDRADLAAGAYTIEWDGRADSGAPVASGVYFARIEHASGTRSKKMMLLK